MQSRERGIDNRVPRGILSVTAALRSGMPCCDLKSGISGRMRAARTVR